MTSMPKQFATIVGSNQYNDLTKRLEVDVKLVLGAVDYGDIAVEIGEDASGLVLHMPDEIQGHLPGSKYKVSCVSIEEEKKIPVYQAIEMRDKLKDVIREYDVILNFSTNKDHSTDTLQSLKTLRNNAQKRLEVIENKLRSVEV